MLIVAGLAGVVVGAAIIAFLRWMTAPYESRLKNMDERIRLTAELMLAKAQLDALREEIRKASAS